MIDNIARRSECAGNCSSAVPRPPWPRHVLQASPARRNSGSQQRLVGVSARAACCEPTGSYCAAGRRRVSTWTRSVKRDRPAARRDVHIERPVIDLQPEMGAGRSLNHLDGHSNSAPACQNPLDEVAAPSVSPALRASVASCTPRVEPRAITRRSETATSRSRCLPTALRPAVPRSARLPACLKGGTATQNPSSRGPRPNSSPIGRVAAVQKHWCRRGRHVEPRLSQAVDQVLDELGKVPLPN